MQKTEALQMMGRCLAEIEQQRNEINYLRPKAEAYDNIAKILSFSSLGISRGAGEDVAWILKQRIQKLGEEITKEREAEEAAKKARAEAETKAELPDGDVI